MSLATAVEQFGLQCTQFLEATVGWLGGKNWPDAKDWASTAKARGLAVNSTPSVGAIATWGAYQGGSQAAGHVAQVVGFQTNGLPIVQEQNWGGNGQTWPDTRALTQSEASSAQYIQPPVGSPTPTPVTSFSAKPDVPVYHQIDTGLGGPPSGHQVAADGSTIDSVVSGIPVIGGVLGPIVSAGDTLTAIKDLPMAIVSAFGSVILNILHQIGNAIANTLRVSFEDLGAFVSNHVVPFAVAGVATAALFA